MIESILQFDREAFLAINKGLANPFFDWIAPLLRNRFFWSPLYLFLLVFLPRNYGRTGWIIVSAFLLTFFLTDMCSSAVLKPTFGRLRPCNDPELSTEVRSLVSCGSGFSFPSSHAANHFALATFLIIVFYRKWKWVLPLGILWALSISFSQVYVGVHYPIDITVGAILGISIGYIISTIFLIYKPYHTWKPGS